MARNDVKRHGSSGVLARYFNSSDGQACCFNTPDAAAAKAAPALPALARDAAPPPALMPPAAAASEPLRAAAAAAAAGADSARCGFATGAAAAALPAGRPVAS